MKEGFGLITVDTLGGLCTLMERSDLPVGLSPLAQNVEFFPGGLRTRDGFKAYLRDVGELAAGFRAFYDHVDGRGIRHHLIYQGGTGKFGSRTSSTTIDPVIAKLGAPQTFSTMRAASMYGKVYTCFSDGRRGLAPPFQWDGNLSASSVGATGATAASVVNDAGGSMIHGRYYVLVAYETASGYITSTTKLNGVFVNGADNGRLDITNIPIGPPGTVARRVFISLADSFDLYGPTSLIINDNTTTSILNVNLSQADIAAGLPFSTFLNLSTPTAHLGVMGYSNRLVYWGGDGKISPFVGPGASGVYSSIGLLNLDFSAMAAAGYQWGVMGGDYGDWYTAGVMTAGQVIAGSTSEGETQNYYRITSDGTASSGLIAQGWGGGLYRPNRDSLGNYYLHPGRRYGIRARVRNPGSAVVGTLNVNLYEATFTGPARNLLASLILSMVSVDDNWAIYESDGTITATSMPSVALEIYASLIPLGATVDISRIEIYDVEEKRGFSSLDISRVFDPESFDVVNGRVTVSPNDGQEIRNAFELRGNLYIAKERSLYVTQDNGSEPYLWNIELVSSTVGTPSVHGVGLGDGWAVIASKNGLYYFTGGEPEKISQEIQPTWDLFDWTKGEQIYVAVNTQDQVVVIGGMRLDGTRQQLRLCYSSGWGNPIPSGEGRKWSVDTLHMSPPASFPMAGFTFAGPITVDDGSSTIAFCVTDYTDARLVLEDPATRTDYSGAIQAIYETAPIGKEMERLLFGAIAAKIRGSGTLAFYYVRPDGSSVALPTKTLTANPLHDLEVRTNNHDTQLGVKLSLLGSGDYMILKRLGVWAKDSPSARLRGY